MLVTLRSERVKQGPLERVSVITRVTDSCSFLRRSFAPLYIPTTLSPFLIPRFFRAEASNATLFLS